MNRHFSVIHDIKSQIITDKKIQCDIDKDKFIHNCYIIIYFSFNISMTILIETGTIFLIVFFFHTEQRCRNMEK